MLGGSATADVQRSASKADVVMLRGKVVTMDDRNRIAEAIAIIGNRIAAVGSANEIGRFIGDETEVWELRGQTVMPGFIDAHNHVEHTARFRHFLLNVHSPPLESAADILELIGEKVAELPAGSWIVGQGTYGQPMPTREALDAVAPEHPVVLRWSMHRQIANGKALAVSGIDRDTPDPPGGRIYRDANGNPNGIVDEAFDLFAIPPYPQDALKEAIRDTLTEIYLKQGVTMVYALPATSGGVRAYQELHERDELPVRVHLDFTIAPGHQPLAKLPDLLKLGIRTGLGDDWLKIGAIKLFVDGSDAAAVMWNQSDEENFGLTRPPRVLNEEVLQAHAAGWQLWLHAIGDKAQDLALDAFEAALKAVPRADHRHRIEHLGDQLYKRETLLRAKRLGVIPVATVAFLWAHDEAPSEGEVYYPLKTLLAMGFRPPGNADSAGTQTFSINPMFSLKAAATRKSKTGAVISPTEAISPLDLIRMHTVYAAHAGFEEKNLGSLEPGKLADLVVLSADPMTAKPENYMDIRVDLTMIDGKVRYLRPGGFPPP